MKRKRRNEQREEEQERARERKQLSSYNLSKGFIARWIHTISVEELNYELAVLCSENVC